MDKYCMHKEITCTAFKGEYYLFTCSTPNPSNNDFEMITEDFKMQNGHTYDVTISGSKDGIALILTTQLNSELKCTASMFIGTEPLLLSKKLEIVNPFSHFHPHELILTSDDESFQKLKQHPNDTLIIICRIKSTRNTFYITGKVSGDTSTGGFNNLKNLAAAFGNSSKSLKEKVLLRVGEESETVNKAILCARSPVFSKMFESNMRELKNNTVTITDIKMPVLKVLVSFLYTGKLPNCDFDFLCDLYYASDKYNIVELSQLCVGLLLPQVSKENVFRTLNLAFSHNIERLKFTAMTCIARNIETLVLTNDWKNLLDNEPEIAVEIINFCDF